MNCDGAGGVGSPRAEEAGPLADQDDWETADLLVPSDKPLEKTWEDAVDEKENAEKEKCNCCNGEFKDANALIQHQRNCAPCAVAFLKLGIKESELFGALRDFLRGKPDLVKQLKVALFSVLKNGDFTYRTRHSRWLLWWMTKLALVQMGRDESVSVLDCGRLLKSNLEESVMLSKKFDWEQEPATMMWVKKFRDLLQMRKIDNLEKFEPLETAADILAAQQQHLTFYGRKKSTQPKMTAEEKQEEEEGRKLAMELKKRITELHCKVPVGAGEASFSPKSMRLIRLLEAIEEQRQKLDLPERSPGSKFDFGGDLLDQPDLVEQIICELQRLTAMMERMVDSSTNFLDVWKDWWDLTKEVSPVLFNNPLDIVRERFREEKERMKVPQRKKLVVELGQLLKCRQARDGEKMLKTLCDCKFVEECQMFFKE